MRKDFIKKFFVGISVASFLIFAATASATIWQVPEDFGTIQEAIDDPNVMDGDKIMVGPGYYEGATVTKAVEIKGIGNAIINSGPKPWVDVGAPEPICSFMAGFFFLPGEENGSGATISHFRFETVEFPVFSRGADDVTVTQCTLINSIQAITNWHGSRWEISHNTIKDLRTSNGGGIGILAGCVLGGDSGDNVISHNEITGTLHVYSLDGGGYNGTGVVLYADFRWAPAYPGADAIAYNRVVKNKISLVSDTPDVVDVCAIELTDTRDDVSADPYPVIFNNKIMFNDLRGTTIQIYLTPLDLDNQNKISRNLGNNRGHGLHPKGFFK